jgi:hypothetical protein
MLVLGRTFTRMAVCQTLDCDLKLWLFPGFPSEEVFTTEAPEFAEIGEFFYQEFFTPRPPRASAVQSPSPASEAPEDLKLCRDRIVRDVPKNTLCA